MSKEGVAGRSGTLRLCTADAKVPDVDFNLMYRSVPGVTEIDALVPEDGDVMEELVEYSMVVEIDEVTSWVKSIETAGAAGRSGTTRW